MLTVIGPDGKTIAHNWVFTGEGVPGLDMSPVQPHTVDRRARACESCHSDPKALGYGVAGGRFLGGYDQDRVLDVDVAGRLPVRSVVQFAGVPDWPHDFSQVVTREGQVLQTDGSHWPCPVH